LNPQHPDPDLDASLKSIEQQMASEGVTRTQFLRIGYLAKQVGLKDEYENLNLVFEICSPDGMVPLCV